MGSRSNNMGADVGGRSSHAKEHFRPKASWIQKYFRLTWNLEGIQRESISGDTIGNEEMCNVERQAKSSGVNFGGARSVTETGKAYATLNWWIGTDSSCCRLRGDNEIV